MKRLTILFFVIFLPMLLFAQKDSTASKFTFSGDFRFRIEQDWDSKKSDGSFRDDRSRLRYRARYGVHYQLKEGIAFAAKIRTGDPKKQQDPQLTLGDEFSSLPIAFEKVYAEFKHKWLNAWLGKNSFPFTKQNELFWSDNVFPEGVALTTNFPLNNKIIESLKIIGGHFIVGTHGESFDGDSYFEGIQLQTSHFQNRIKFYPAFYYFHQMPNIPDGNETFTLDYSILHIGASAEILQKPRVEIHSDYYANLEDYSQNDSIPKSLRNEKNGFVGGIKIGKLKEKHDWQIDIAYTQMERYAAVDFFAQNDWARWDYSSQGSADGRLTNFKGFEIKVAYNLDKAMNLQLRYFNVDQIIPYGIASETNNRIRLDFNIGF